MKKQIVSIITVLGLAAAFVTPALSEDLDSLAGKWTAEKSSEGGKGYKQQIEIKKNKFTLKITDSDNDVRLYAEGDVKLDKAGPFKTMVFSNIKAGQSSSDTTEIDDTYTSIYRVRDDDGALLLVTNFDKDRDSQKPSLDIYHKEKPAEKRAEK